MLWNIWVHFYQNTKEPFFSFRHLRYTDGLVVDADNFSHCIISFGGFGGKPQRLHFDYLDITMPKNKDIWLSLFIE